jgi:hypothetical protein
MQSIECLLIHSRESLVLATGSLFDLIHNPTQELPFALRIKMLRDTAQGMAYLHGQDPVIIHRYCGSSVVTTIRAVCNDKI